MENNFNFFVGSWTGRNRTLKEPFVGSDEWTEFESVARCWNLFDGAGNIDEITFPTRGQNGCTVRLHDPDTDLWTLYWFSTRHGLGLPPVVGRFGPDGRGVFTSEEEFQGRDIVCRYLWCDITPDSCRWEQAYSTDKGETWETNWIMEFTRTA